MDNTLEGIRFENISNGKNYRESIKTLLAENMLPTSDLNSAEVMFILVFDNETLVGCIGVEHYAKAALLRSFVIDQQYRNKGIGNLLLQRLLGYCQKLGVEYIHLLTSTAEQYFELKGFVKSKREEAPESIKSTSEFSSMCPVDSSYMVLKLFV